MVKKIWSVVPKDYKAIIKGKKYVMVRTSKGASMVGVNHSLAKKQWGKYCK
jgi:hypothetical protein